MLKQFKPITYVALHNCYYNDIFELIKNFFAAPQKNHAFCLKTTYLTMP